MYSYLFIIATLTPLSTAENEVPELPHQLKSVQSLRSWQPEPLPAIPDIDITTDQRLSLRKVRRVSPLSVRFNYSGDPLPELASVANVQGTGSSSRIRIDKDEFLSAAKSRWDQQMSLHSAFINESRHFVNDSLLVFAPGYRSFNMPPPVFDVNLLNNTTI